MSITPDAKRPTVRFNVQLMAEDAAALGLTNYGWAKRAKVADMTVIRFLRGDFQTPPTAKKLAAALGHQLERYVIRSGGEGVTA